MFYVPFPPTVAKVPKNIVIKKIKKTYEPHPFNNQIITMYRRRYLIQFSFLTKLPNEAIRIISLQQSLRVLKIS